MEGHFWAPYTTAALAKRHGFAGARSVGGMGGHFWAPYVTAALAKRHGFAGARSVGGMGGHFVALPTSPHETAFSGEVRSR